MGEIAGSVGVLGNYQKSIECKDQNGTGSVVASVGADSAGPLDVTVGYQDDIVCTVSNVRETGKLEVVKGLSPRTILAGSTCRSTARRRRPTRPMVTRPARRR